MTISPVQDDEESSDDDTWGPLTKAIADYKKEGRVITKESLAKEMKETLNCECCIKERQEKMRRKLEAGMVINKVPSARQKARDQRKFDQLMTILNGAITDSNGNDESKKLTVEELKDIEMMTDRSFKEISEGVQKKFLEDLSNGSKLEEEITKQAIPTSENKLSLNEEAKQQDDTSTDSVADGSSNDADEVGAVVETDDLHQQQTSSSEGKPPADHKYNFKSKRVCGNPKCEAAKGKLHRCSRCLSIRYCSRQCNMGNTSNWLILLFV